MSSYFDYGTNTQPEQSIISISDLNKLTRFRDDPISDNDNLGSLFDGYVGQNVDIAREADKSIQRAFAVREKQDKMSYNLISIRKFLDQPKASQELAGLAKLDPKEQPVFTQEPDDFVKLIQESNASFNKEVNKFAPLQPISEINF